MNNLFKNIKILFSHISSLHKRLIFLNFILLITASIAEVISISAIIPFLSIITKSDYSISSKFLSEKINVLYQFDTLYILIFFIISILIASIMRVVLLYTSTKIAFVIGHDLSKSLYKKIINQDYLFFTKHKSSEIINAISFKSTHIIYQIITPLISIVSSLVLILFIVSLLLLVNPFISLISFITFGIVYLLIALIVRKRLSIYSVLISNRSSLIVKLIQESFSSIREILINSSQKKEIKLFSDANHELRNAQAFSGFIGNVPKIIVESCTLIAFAGISYIYIDNNDAGVDLIPFFGALALGAQKILPLIQNIFLSYTYIQTAKDSLVDINYYLNLRTPIENRRKKINFSNFIQFDSLSFSYGDKQNILNNVDLLINKGDKVGIIGASGSGKSTLIDILSGLLPPTSGNFIVDKKKLNSNDLSLWKNNISLISQNFYIHNLSILETLLFNIDKKIIKQNKKLTDRLDKVLSLSRCDFVKNINESFGENAIKLSGGQKQRLAIARGLMKDANIYIFDEATSALDEKNEQIILKNIFEYLNKKTCIFISHNKAALKFCNKIYSIKSNKVIQIK